MMNSPRCFLHFLLLTSLCLAGCGRRTQVLPPPTPVPAPVARTETRETLRLGEMVDAFKRNPSEANRAEVRKAMADLDGEIAELEALVAKRSGADREEAAAKLRNLQEYRAGEAARFKAAEAGAPVAPGAPVDARTGAEKAEDVARKAGNAIEEGAQKAGDAIRDLGR